MNVQLSHLIFGCAALLLACNSKPTVVEPVSPSASQPMISDAEKSASHKVTVEEVLQATKYTYLLVRESGEPYWIAISKADVEKGETCVYTGGLKMRGFQSSELDRVFDELILVSNISRMVPGGSGAASELFSKMKEGEKPVAKDKIVSVKGAVKISDLLSNPSRYEGKMIMVTGRCTKINMQIMGRNWIHITDESGVKSELTITTQDALEVGRVGVFEGKISLDKDFGAGYRYDIIMEEAVKK